MKTDALAPRDWQTEMKRYSRAGPQAPWGAYSIKEQEKKLLSPGNSSSWCLTPLAQTPIPVPAQPPIPVQIADSLRGGRSSSGSWCLRCPSITLIGCSRTSVLTHCSSRREIGSHQGQGVIKDPPTPSDLLSQVTPTS